MLTRLRNVLKRHGAIGSVKVVFRHVQCAVRGHRSESVRARTTELAFDRRFGVDTSEPCPPVFCQTRKVRFVIRPRH